MDAYSELEQLLADQLDGPPDSVRNKKLAALLRAHPDLQVEYLDYLQLHALLQWRGGNVHPKPVLEGDKAQCVPEPVFASRSRWRSRRGFAAALLGIAACVAAFFLFYSPEAHATSDVVERLIELNLDLAQTPTRQERTRIYDEQVTELKTTLAKAALPQEDRELAETLLENSTWLTKNDDPMAEADRFNDIADKLVVRMDAATTAKDAKRIVQLASDYHRLTEVGIDANLERAFASGALHDAEHKKKLERTTFRHANRAKVLEEIVARNPEASRRAIHRAMKTHLHKNKSR